MMVVAEILVIMMIRGMVVVSMVEILMGWG